MLRFLADNSNYRVIFPLFLLVCFFTFYLFPGYQQSMREAAGESVAPLDTRFGYSVDEVIADFEKLGPDGREVYRDVVGRVDMFYPLVYGLLFVFVLAWALKKVAGRGSNWIFLSLLPLAGVLCDYLENIGILGLLDRFPNLVAEEVAQISRITIVKHIAGLASVAIILGLSIFLLIRKVRRRTKISA